MRSFPGKAAPRSGRMPTWLAHAEGADSCIGEKQGTYAQWTQSKCSFLSDKWAYWYNGGTVKGILNFEGIMNEYRSYTWPCAEDDVI